MLAGWLRRFDDALGWAEDRLLALAHGVIAVLVIAAVVFRYGLNDPLIWTEEIVITLFAWMLFVGLASGFRHRMHLRIDALLLVLPRTGRTMFAAAAVASTLATLLLLAWYGTEQSFIMLQAETPMLRISSAWAVSALPAGAMLSIVHVLRHALCCGLEGTLWPVNGGAVH